MSRGVLVAGAVLVVILLGAFVAVVVADIGQQEVSSPPEGVQSFEVTDRDHVQGSISYSPIPPVGGKHAPVWQNCGFYEEPVHNETAVHSMEHGAVWITYRPDLPQGQVEELRRIAQNNDFVLISPYPDLPAPVVASAWGKQLELDSAEDERLERFVSAFVQGPQTPEPGAPCSGGTSATVSGPVDLHEEHEHTH